MFTERKSNQNKYTHTCTHTHVHGYSEPKWQACMVRV